MLIHDELYGSYLLEDVLVDLIESEEVQRLKDIHMAGAAYLVNPLWNETRYEHSVGVMLLIRRLGGSLEEQIAGLLHDISHTAFSHLIDFVLKKEKEDFHEEIKAEWLQGSSIPSILSEHGYEYTQLLLDDSQWCLLEQSAPDLCADRIDYTLREVHRYFDVALEDVHRFINQLVVDEGKVCLSDLHSGEWFVHQYRKIVIDFFYDPLNVYSHEIVGKLLAYALKTDEITLIDLMQTDTEVWGKIQVIKAPEIAESLALLNTPVRFERVDENQPYDGFQKKKVRYVDPLILDQGKHTRVSERSTVAKKIIEDTLTEGKKGIYFKCHTI